MLDLQKQNEEFEALAKRLIAAKENSDSWRTALSLAHDMIDCRTEKDMLDLEAIIHSIETRNEIRVGDEIRSYDFIHTDQYFCDGKVFEVKGPVIKFESNGRFLAADMHSPHARVVKL